MKFKDEKGKYIVQGLFLENGYNTKTAVYTLDGKDKSYKGTLYPSLKALYLEESDPSEYMFAEKNLFDWAHWQRLCNNAICLRHIEKWRDELTLSLRGEGIATMIDLAVNQSSYQAAKYLVEEGWMKKTRGRPSKEEIDGKIAQDIKLKKEFEEGFELLTLHKEKKSG